MNRILSLLALLFLIFFYYLLLSCHNFEDKHNTNQFNINKSNINLVELDINENSSYIDLNILTSKSTEGFDAGKCIITDNNRNRQGIKCLPLFIIVGSMKCGTGEMMKWLQLHPLLRVGKGKEKINQRETHYFTRHISHTHIINNHNYSNVILRNYLEHFSYFTLKESKTLFNFEKSPDYIRNATALQIIKSVLPNIKLVIILRDPVKRALSEFFHHCRHKRYLKFIHDYNTSTVYYNTSAIDSNDSTIYYNRNDIINSATTGLLQDIPSYYYSTLLSCDMKHAEIYFTQSLVHKYYVADELRNGLYYNQLLGLLEIYSNEKVLILLQEEMYRNTFEILKEIEHFLGIFHFNYSSVSKNTNINTHPPKRLNDKIKSRISKRNSDELYSQSSLKFRKLLEMFYYDQNQKLLNLLIDNNYTLFSKFRLQYNGWKL